MTRVLIVDDSAVSRAALRLALQTDPKIEIVAEADDGASAHLALATHSPDLVTMDVFLQRENGLDITQQIMSAAPCPVLIVTAADTSDPGLIYRAIEAGALEVWSKPPSPFHRKYADYCRQLTRLVRALSTVPVTHRRPFASRAERAPQQQPARVENGCATQGAVARRTPDSGGPQVLILGASTGGPPVVAELIRRLDPDFVLPVVLIQHMANGFLSSFATWLQGVCGRKVNIVRTRDQLRPGEVFLPEEDRHLVFVSGQAVETTPEPSNGLHRPSIDITFHSAAAQLGAKALAVLLTGMGKDGAAGLLALRRQSATTIAQELATCTIDSMPRNAIKLSAACHVASPEAIPDLLRRCLSPL